MLYDAPCRIASGNGNIAQLYVQTPITGGAGQPLRPTTNPDVTPAPGPRPARGAPQNTKKTQGKYLFSPKSVGVFEKIANFSFHESVGKVYTPAKSGRIPEKGSEIDPFRT